MSMISDQNLQSKIKIYKKMGSNRERNQQLVTLLNEAAIEGDVNLLQKMVQEDEHILDRCMIQKSDILGQSPLHVAVSLGHLHFTKSLIQMKPELTEDLDALKRSSALHMAVTKSHLDIVKELVTTNSRMCFVNDRYGRNPVHVAAMIGKVDVLEVLVSMNPQAAKARTSDGDTVLHLCVKYTQPSSLKCLVKAMADFNLVNCKDADGNTILHLAVQAKHLEMVQYLVTNKKMEINAKNTNGLTARDILNQNEVGKHDEDIRRAMKNGKALEAKYAKCKPKDVEMSEWLEKKRNALMVVASLIATMAFQVGVNPPGGAWQDGSRLDQDGYPPNFSADAWQTKEHVAGTSIMASQDIVSYQALLIWNTIAFLSSLSVILLLISGLPWKRFLMFVLMVVMWIAITATAFTYSISVGFLCFSSPHKKANESVLAIVLGLTTLSWAVLITLMLLIHGVRAIRKLIKRFLFTPAKTLVQWIIKCCLHHFKTARPHTLTV